MNLRTTGLAIACVLVALVAAPDTGRSTTPAQAATEPPHVPFAIRTAEIAAAVALRDIPLPDPPRSITPAATSRPQAARATRMAAPDAATVRRMSACGFALSAYSAREIDSRRASEFAAVSTSERS